MAETNENNSIQTEIANLRAEINALKIQVKSLRRQNTFFDHWHNTVCSPLHKRLWWWVQGYRFSCLGRWYRAPWNEGAAKYEGRD